jgi:hypothetical protein
MKAQMKAVAISLASITCVLVAITLPHTSSAQVALVFQTTFDDASCPTVRLPGEHWRSSDYFGRTPGVDPCTPTDGIRPNGGWTANGFEDRILAEANYPAGGGGKGFRHYRCDGTNCNGGGLSIQLPTGYTELWARFYMRYQLGFAWVNGQPHYTKDNYVNVGTPAGWVFGIQGAASWGIFNGSVGVPSSKSWSSTMAGTTGDGLWHCYEWHIQHGSNARIEIWVDDAQVLSTITTMPAGSTSFLTLGDNQDPVTGSGAIPWYTDYDDLAFSSSGRIGCTYGTPAARLAAPRNLRVQ